MIVIAFPRQSGKGKKSVAARVSHREVVEVCS